MGSEMCIRDREKNSRDTWNAIRLLSQSGSKASHMLFSSDELNAYFGSVFEKPSTMPPIPSDLPSDDLVTEVYEVKRHLSKLRRKSPGPDGIPYWVLRKSATSLSPAITYIFNESLTNGSIPPCFKMSNISPIPKCSRPSSISDYRPISLLPSLSKILERIVSQKWIVPCVQSKLDPSQFAYFPGPGKGTACATTLIYHHIIRHLDSSSGAVRVLSADFSKAFDKLDHAQIISAMINLRLPFEACKWVRDFLTSRTQRVAVKGNPSNWTPVTSGVPQGSVLGPLLFCIVANGFRPTLKNSVIVKYADDFTILHFINKTSSDNLQIEWNALEQWSMDMNLPLNFSKCRVMDVITKENLVVNRIFTSSGAVLDSIESLSLLGVIFSNTMRWNDHVDRAVRKASRRLFMVRNLKRSRCPLECILHVYYQCIRSVLLYCFPCFCNLSDYLFSKLVRIERRVLRIVASLDACNPPLDEAANNLCRHLFKRICDSDAHPLRAMFTSRPARSRSQIPISRPFARTKRLSDSFLKFCP